MPVGIHSILKSTEFVEGASLVKPDYWVRWVNNPRAVIRGKGIIVEAQPMTGKSLLDPGEDRPLIESKRFLECLKRVVKE